MPRSCGWRSSDPDALDLPLQLDAAGLFHAAAHLFAKAFYVCGCGVSAIDEEIAMHLAHLRVAADKPATTGCVNKLPGALRLWVLEG
jgi:hypothetical protein